MHLKVLEVQGSVFCFTVSWLHGSSPGLAIGILVALLWYQYE